MNIEILVGALLASIWITNSVDTLTYAGQDGPGKGKHIVFLAGDEEYRSEEALPQLARILAFRHGFRCTVLFSIDEQGDIDPTAKGNQPGLEALGDADLVILSLRFREWPDAQMSNFVRYYFAGKPILALRTSTHTFDYGDGSTSAYRKFGWRSKEWPGGFGRQVLGETWVSHWGEHGRQATMGIVEPSQTAHAILRGVKDVFGTTDVYEASPPADCTVLVRGKVLSGMDRASPPAAGRKKRQTGLEQGLNEPMMPIVWVRHHRNAQGKVNLVLTCTMGAATDLLDEGIRRLLVNGTYWLCGLEREIAANANVEFVGDYRPSAFGFGGYRRGVRPKDLAFPPG